jgi:hypothetical protein
LSVAHDLSRDPAHEEDNLLIEAVSLLVQRHHETETWLAEQIEQADERAANVERRYADLEARLGGIEETLDRLLRDFEPARGDAAVGQRLARLREQVADLRSVSDGRTLRSVPSAAEPASAPLPTVQPTAALPIAPAAPASPPVVESVVAVPASAVPTAAPPAAAAAATARPSLWERAGPTDRHRFGLVAMAIGVAALLYALFSQLHFG